MKIAIILYATYRLNEIPIKFSMTFFTEIEKEGLNKKDIAGGRIIPAVKL